MNLKLARVLTPLLLLALTCLTPFALRAQSTSPGNLLRQAYVTLSVADHDYKGHRAEAMKQIEAAGKLLKVDVHGDGKGHEKQGVSDEQLRVARGLLDQARPELKGKPLKHVEKAIGEIDVALKIR